MALKGFKFISPGVFINEIDESFRQAAPDTIGPVIVGRAARGPAMLPIKVENFEEFSSIFGETVPGQAGGDVYRDGNFQSPMYGTYAAKAFLNSQVAPVTFVRLLGQQASNNEAGADAQAGWVTTGTPVDGTTAGGAFGIFVAPSSSNPDFSGTTNGFRLGAIIYVQSGSVALAGTVAGNTPTALGGGDTVTSSATLIESDENGNFKVVINGTTAGEKSYIVNWTDTDDNFIRKSLNTNPQYSSTQGDFYPSSSYEDYWLGESFEQFINDHITSGVKVVGTVVGIASGSALASGPHKMKDKPSQEAIAGWFIGQDEGAAASFNPETATKLFRFIGLGHGEWLNKNVKVAIENIKPSSTTTSDYGTFSVVLKTISSINEGETVLERFDNLNLDPTSPNYISRVIGDEFYRWDEGERRLKKHYNNPNNSAYIRVEMSDTVEDGGAKTLLPFGYFGPPKFRDISESVRFENGVASTAQFKSRFFVGGDSLPGSNFGTEKDQVISSSFAAVGGADGAGFTGSFFYPEDRRRASNTDSLAETNSAYWGFQVTETTSDDNFDNSVADAHRLLHIELGQSTNVPVDTTESTYQISASSGIEGWSYIFTLDNLVATTSGGVTTWADTSGSRAGGTSYTAVNGADSLLRLEEPQVAKFHAPFFGGFDGLDITKPDPFYNRGMGSTATRTNSYAYYTIERAIDTVSDPEYINMNLLTVPGITNTKLTERMVRNCSARGDAMALIDLPDVYIPSHERYYSDKTNRIGTTPRQAATSLRNRKIDSSYGATYYPWVQTRDTGTGQLVWIPPTVAMVGVLGSSERQSAVWFAPAGFNRGGMTQGAAGISVTNVSERLTSAQRDTLYENRINPIASFPSSGIVAFGQKTLQERQSALDRINVRRLVIYLKKQISIVANDTLFEQNVEATWNNFKAKVRPILQDVKTRFGIERYSLTLDSTTTTPDLVDQNILYAKIKILPAKAIEFIAIDFAITNSGAGFDD